MNVGEHPGRKIFQHPHWGGKGADSELLRPQHSCMCLLDKAVSPWLLTFNPQAQTCFLSFIPSGLSYQQSVNLPAKCDSDGAAGASFREHGSLYVILLGKVLFHFCPAEYANCEHLDLFVKEKRCNDFLPCLVWNRMRTSIWGNQT